VKTYLEKTFAISAMCTFMNLDPTSALLFESHAKDCKRSSGIQIQFTEKLKFALGITKNEL